MASFTDALYDTEGVLVKWCRGEPIWSDPTAQQVADMIALAADEGCTYGAGTFQVWIGEFEPGRRIEDNRDPDAERAFGEGLPPVPRYRWDRRNEWDVILVPLS